MNKVIVTLLISTLLLLANNRTTDTNMSKLVDSNISVPVVNKELESLTKSLKDLTTNSLDNVWTKTYSGYVTHKRLLDRQKVIKKRVFRLSSLRKLTKKQKREFENLKKESSVLSDKINLIKDFEQDPFNKLIEPPKLEDAPTISNPFAIIGGLSYIKELDNTKKVYTEKYKLLIDTIEKIEKKVSLISKIAKISNNSLDKQHLSEITKELKEFLTIKDIYSTTKDVYIKKADEVKLSIQNSIKRELEKTVKIIVIALFFLSIFIGLKFLTRKYLSDRESFYTVNKVINISFITILLITILLAYLENVSYLVTILGFASAGIAIAMKDWFMSLMGWFVIVIGGAIHVGDRIKVVRGTSVYVGDVIDISMLRMTIQEDVTLTTYTTNRRAGRIIFIPNNYIFTDLIANYSHSGLKTVWDGIDFYITFDSNITKSTNIAKSIAKQYSKGYTDITRKQLNRLRSKYQLKNTNVEPRVFSFIEGYGVKVSVWYLTNAYATLTLRSTISNKILEAILAEPDIKIAYPTQSFYVNNKVPKPDIIEEENPNV